MHQVFSEYADRQGRLRRDVKTRQKFDMAARRFTAWCDETSTDPIAVQSWQLEEYFAGCGLSPATQRVELMWLKAAFDFALLRGLDAPNFRRRDVKLETVPDTNIRIIGNDELRLMRGDIVDEPSWALFHVLAYTGLRRAEACSLRWSEVNLKQQSITVVGKGGKLRHVPVHPALGEVLSGMRYRLDWPVLAGKHGGASITPVTKRLATFAGEYAFHDFRRTVASSLAINSVPIPVINRIMGWSSGDMLERRYFNVAGPNLREAILKLYADDPV